MLLILGLGSARVLIILESLDIQLLLATINCMGGRGMQGREDTLLAYRALLRGAVGHSQISLSGSGTIDEVAGMTIGDYSIECLPRDFNPHLLSACIITGYPNASAERGRTPNVFRGHSYSYARTIMFRSGEQLELTAKCSVSNGRLESAFALNGTYPIVEKLASIDPVVESWTPEGAGKVSGFFTITWRGPDGLCITADAQSHYRIDTTETLRQPIDRHISIVNEIAGTVLTKRQLSFNTD